MPKIIVVALKIHFLDKEFKAFLNLQAIEKMELIKKKIQTICGQLKTSHPTDKWIIAWPENGIAEICSVSLKKAFKKMMLDITQTNPNLTILGGTLLTSKKTPLEKSKEILTYYNQSLWLEKLENSENIENQIQSHRTKVKKLAEIKSTVTREITINRNTCYIFEGSTVKRFDKIAPYYEVGHNQNDSIFKPGGKKGKNLEHFFTLFQPDEKDFNIGIEICREHTFGVIKHLKSSQKVLIHFLLSSYNPVILSNVAGDYVIHVDSLEDPKIIKTSDDKESVQDVILYTNNLFTNETNLTPIKPDFSFKTLLLKELTILQKYIPNESKAFSALTTFKKMLNEKIISDEYYINEKLYFYFTDQINQLITCCKKDLILEEKNELFEKLYEIPILLKNRYLKSKLIDTAYDVTPDIRKKIIFTLENYIYSTQTAYLSKFINNN